MYNPNAVSDPQCQHSCIVEEWGTMRCRWIKGHKGQHFIRKDRFIFTWPTPPPAKLGWEDVQVKLEDVGPFAIWPRNSY